MDLAPQLSPKFIKFFFTGGIVVYFGMTFLIKAVILEDVEGGFVFGPDDEIAQLLLYVFAGVSIFALVLQFILPRLLKSSAEMVRLTLCESIGILGFVFFLMSGQMVESWIFMGVSLLALLFGERQPTKAL